MKETMKNMLRKKSVAFVTKLHICFSKKCDKHSNIIKINRLLMCNIF
ncbi:hypothetical protein SAMN03159286_2709 [Enterobacter sp. NFIX58]|nr:hypothetical protein SAMN03159286_2709 [Enterobacter sp. NFIX58]